MSDFTTKDSGARIDFATGSRRDTESGKRDFTLLPFTGLERVVALLERGAVKYGRHNWAKGQSMGRAERSMWRHIIQYQRGERDEDHLAAVVFNALLILDHEERIASGELPAELDDRDEHRRPGAPPRCTCGRPDGILCPCGHAGYCAAACEAAKA